MVTGAFPLPSQAFIANKARGLAERGHDVTVLASRPGEPLPGPIWAMPPGTLRVIYLDPRRSPSSVAWRSLRGAATAPRRVARMAGRAFRRDHPRDAAKLLLRSVPLLADRAEIVHFEWATKAAEAVEVLDLLGGKVVVSCRGTDVRIMAPADAELAGRLARVFTVVDGIHCVSDAVREDAMALGAPAEKVTVNRPAVDTGFFVPPPQRTQDPNCLRLVSIGRAHWVKGYDYALRALRTLLDQGHAVRYSILGPRGLDDDGGLAVGIRDLGLDGVVEVHGAGDRHAVRDLLWGADVFLLPSLSEGLSNSALEAMATGLPVVASCVGGMGEAIRDGVDGLLVPPRDPPALAAAIVRLAHDDFRMVLGERARERAVTDFDLARQLDGFEAWYRCLVGTS